MISNQTSNSVWEKVHALVDQRSQSMPSYNSEKQISKEKPWLENPIIVIEPEVIA